MIHEMRLDSDIFEKIKNGNKTIEYRLYDEKRRNIKVGDKIEFKKRPDFKEIILVEVTKIYTEKTFEDLFRKFYSNEDKIKESASYMNRFYSPEKINEYGVIAIKFTVLKHFFRYTYNKLVRDKIPKNIEKDIEKTCKYRVLNDEEYLLELNKKVIEEVNEFIENNSIEELGDLIEVLNAIMKAKDYKMDEVNTVMKEKQDKKRAFNNKIYLEYIDEQNRNADEEKELNKDFRIKS